MSRQMLITMQPAPIVDGYAPDGSEMTRLPYPVHAWASDGAVPSHLGGYTEPRRIVGFTTEEGRDQNRLDLNWASAALNPRQIEGMFIVCQLPNGEMQLLTSVVDTVEVREFERPDTITPLREIAPDGQRRSEGWQ